MAPLRCTVAATDRTVALTLASSASRGLLQTRAAYLVESTDVSEWIKCRAVPCHAVGATDGTVAPTPASSAGQSAANDTAAAASTAGTGSQSGAGASPIGEHNDRQLPYPPISQDLSFINARDTLGRASADSWLWPCHGGYALVGLARTARWLAGGLTMTQR